MSSTFKPPAVYGPVSGQSFQTMVPITAWPRKTAPVSTSTAGDMAGVPGAPSPVVPVNYTKGLGPGVGYRTPQTADNIVNATLGFINQSPAQPFVPR